MKIDWVAQAEAPSPMGLVAYGQSSVTLLAKLALLPEPTRSMLNASAHQDMLIVTGNDELLPWVDGVQYIAALSEAPGLWLPTTIRPNIPLDLLMQAIRRKYTQNPILMVPHPSQLVPLHRLLPISDALLTRIQVLWDS